MKSLDFAGRAIGRRTAFILAIASTALLTTNAEANEEGTEVLEAQVQKQQETIERQQEQINRLERRFDALEVGGVDEPVDAPVVETTQRRLRLALSGQVNRAVSVLSDGDDVGAFFVDNDTSNTRFRLVGSADVAEGLRVLARVEFGVSANNSSRVSQDNEQDGDVLEVRLGEILVESNKFGRLSVGRGFSVSDATAEVDLSRTQVITYSNWSLIAGGIQFFDGAADDLSGVTVGNGFGNRDGLGRDNRVSYETPRFAGFSLGAGVSSLSRFDGAVRWAGEGYGFQVAAAASVARFNASDIVDLRFSNSISALHTRSGLNLTFASGVDERDNTSMGQNYYAKAGWITRVFDAGESALAIDYTRTVNLPTRRDAGHGAGVSAVQHLARYGAEIYATARWVDLHRTGLDLKEIWLGATGVRLRF